MLRKWLLACATVGFAVAFALAVLALLFLTGLKTTTLLAIANVIEISSLGVVEKGISNKTTTATLIQLYTRTALGDFRVRNIYTKSPPAIYAEMTVR